MGVYLVIAMRAVRTAASSEREGETLRTAPNLALEQPSPPLHSAQYKSFCAERLSGAANLQ